MDNNFVEEFLKFVESIKDHNELMTGGEDDTVEIDGVTQPSFRKDIKDRLTEGLTEIKALVDGRAVFETLAELNASGVPTIPSSQTTVAAEVLNDTTEGNNGLYVWDVSEAGWVYAEYNLNVDSIYDSIELIETYRVLLSETESYGYPLPILENTIANDSANYIFGDEISADGKIDKVYLYAASAGALKIRTWTRSGDTFTVKLEQVITVETGSNEINVDLDVLSGEYFGFHGSGLVGMTASTADGSGWYAGGAGATSFTDATKTTSSRLHIAYELSQLTRIDTLEESITNKAEQSDIESIKADIYQTKSVTIGQSGEIEDGGYDVDAGLYALEQVAQVSGLVTEFSLYSVAAGDIRVCVFEKTGDVFTVVDEITVAASGGYESFDINLGVENGQYLGAQSTNIGLKLGVSDTFGWYGAGGTDSFTDASATNTSRVLIGFVVSYQSADLESRPYCVDLPWKNMLLLGHGQSLWEGSDGDVTTSVEYDNKGFAAYPAAPSVIYDATVANTERSGTRGEWPMLGAAASIRAALLRDHNIDYPEIKSTVVVANNAVSGAYISEIKKGTAPYESAISQAASLQLVTGESSGVLAVSYGQGESDSVDLTDPAAYLADLIQLADDFDTDLRAASGQSKRVPMVVYQMNSTGREIGLMHLQSSIDSPLIYCAGPMYPYTYFDTLHIDATSSRLVGALHGEVIKKVSLDGEDWHPLRAVSSSVIGNSITLTFNKSGLVFDTTALPTQTNNGFYVTDSLDAAVTVNSVEIVNDNQVRINCNSTPDSDWTIHYGLAASGRADSFVGKMGNLRDNAGVNRVFDGNEIHNWCVVFDYSI